MFELPHFLKQTKTGIELVSSIIRSGGYGFSLGC